ncbi:hypothetical protein MMC16_006103 [Acarospora aff. strigata]|nr:hypothetical protein [Acarospora aff. strigata]
MANAKRDTLRSIVTAKGSQNGSMDVHPSGRAESFPGGPGTVLWHTFPYHPNTFHRASGPHAHPRRQPAEQAAEQRTEELGRTDSFLVRSHVLSPPISPMTQPPTHQSRPEDKREYLSASQHLATPVKEEPGSNVERSAAHGFPTDASFRTSMSVSDADTVKQPPPRRTSLADAVPQAFNNTMPSPMALSVPSILSSQTSSGMDTQQRDLFEALVRVCTNAARTYWRSQCRSYSTAVVYRPRAEHGRYRTAPYGRPASRSYHVMMGAQRRRTLVAEAPRGLMDHLVCIADGLWERAIASGSHAEELQAVHRMGNLYSWGDRVVNAAREMELLSDEAVYAVVMAARDLVSWLLCEEGKREIDGLWEGRWVFGGIGVGRVD